MTRSTSRLIAAIFCLGAPQLATAQSEPFAIGADLMVFEGDIRPAFGLSAYSLPHTRFGYYGTIYGSVTLDEPFYDDLSRGAFGDAVTDEYQLAYGFNVGFAGRLTDNFALFAGVGYGWLDGQVEQFDPTRILSSDGYYYLDDPTNDDDGFDGQVGALASFGTFSLSASYHSFFDTFSVGIGSRF